EGALPEIWSYGHRNPQGLAFHPDTGVLWSNEHGPQGGDELNVIRKGANYGWPVIGYGMNYVTGTMLHRGREKEGMEQPAAIWVPSIGIWGLASSTGHKCPAWRGNAIRGGVSGPAPVRLSSSGASATNREQLLAGEYRIRDVRTGPDGSLYLLTESQYGQPTSIYRLEPAEE